MMELLVAGSARQSQSGEGSQAAQGRLMEWPLSGGALRAPPSALTQLPGLLDAIERLTACAGQAAHMRQLLLCQDVCLGCCMHGFHSMYPLLHQCCDRMVLSIIHTRSKGQAPHFSHVIADGHQSEGARVSVLCRSMKFLMTMTQVSQSLPMVVRPMATQSSPSRAQKRNQPLHMAA